METNRLGFLEKRLVDFAGVFLSLNKSMGTSISTIFRKYLNLESILFGFLYKWSIKQGSDFYSNIL